MSARGLIAGLAAVALAGLTGCSGFDRLDFIYSSAPPDGAAITYEGISLHAGIALGVEARPMDGDEVMDTDTRVELTSDNPGVIGVSPALPEDDVDDDEVYNWKFVIYGVGAGSSSITVTIDGEIEGEIPATISPQ